MKVHVFAVACSLLFLHAPGLAYGYTSAETNEVVKALLFGSFIHHDNLEEPLGADSVPDVRTPENFFRLPVGGNWSDEGKRAAFDIYLAGMGCRDYTNESNAYYTVTELAVAQCEFMSYTNALPHLKNLILNPTCSHRVRRRAIETVVPMMNLTVDETRFIETVFTNVAMFTRAERGMAGSRYIRLLLSSVTNGQPNAVVMEDSVNRFYRHRKCDTAGATMLDMLFASQVAGYSASSNRLDFATYVLDHAEGDEYLPRYFVPITNQLHTAGLPLRWIDVGGSDR